MKAPHQNDQVTSSETAEILRLAWQCLPLVGDFVELGCYRGDTSVLLGKLLQEYSTSEKLKSANINYSSAKDSPNIDINRKLWIYDSFAGLPDKTAEDASGAGANFQAGELLVTKREVVAKIRKHGLQNIMIKKAWFSDLTEQDLPQEIAFAFCDGDLYSSIKTSLQLVVPRLSRQGIIIVHDYNNPELPGSSRAVDEFLRSHPQYRLQVRYTLAILSKEC